MKKKSQLFIVTGYSGAGKSTALGAFEDAGFYCVDNLPSALIGPFFQLIVNSNEGQFALGLDVRGGEAIEQIVALIETMSYTSKPAVKILFLSAAPRILQKRFHETRRNHPLAENIDLSKAIGLEKEMLVPLLELADTVLQTDQLSAQQLRQLVRSSFINDSPQQIIVSLISFGFKHGTPHECNFLYDVRSLPNPYFEPSLRDFDGTNKCIQDYLFSKKLVCEYWQRLIDFILYTITQSYQEGRFFITIGIGCTGGRHRSVAFVEKLSELKLDNVLFNIKHRDIQLEARVKKHE